jgi:arsenate reductase-like glutaredoxin family protein
VSCTKAWDAFTAHNAIIAEEVNARKEVYTEDDLDLLVNNISQLVVTSGKKILRFDPKSSELKDAAVKMFGRTGNLRAPAVRIGTTLYVGYNAELYEALLS